MGLSEQVVAFPLVGGVDENAHPRLCSRLLTMENCRQFEGGALGKRHGTTCIGLYNLRLDGSTPPTGELLCAYGSDIVRVGYGHVDTCRVIASSDCIYKGRASEALVYRQTLTSGESYITDCDVAYGNGFTIYVCRSNAGILLSGTASILYFVLDANGAIVVPRTVLDSATSTAIGRAHVVVVGTTAIFTWGNAAGVRGCTLSLTTLTLGATSTILASVGKYAICALSDRVAIVYESALGMAVTTFTPTLATQIAGVGISATTGTSAWAIEGRTGGTLYLGYVYSAGGTLFVKAMGVDPTSLATTFALTTVTSGATADVGYTLGIGLNAAGTTAWYAWTRGVIVSISATTTQAMWCSVSSAGSVGIVRYSYQLGFASKPFVANGVLYALVTNVHSTHATHFLVHLYDGTTPLTSEGMRIVATVAPRQVPRGALIYGSGVVSSVALVSSGRYAIGAVVAGSIVDSFVASLLDVRLGATSPVACEAGGLLVLSGGAPSAFDGASVVELGMPWEPDIAQMSASIAAGGSMTAGVYYYLIVYEWRFATGAVVRSIPSYPYAYRIVDGVGATVPLASRGLLTVTAAGANLKGSVTVADLNLTNKQPFSGAPNGVSLVLYRTESGGATFYRASEIQIAAASLNQVNNTTVVITDGVSDADLVKRPTLYVEGGALPSEIPPSAAHVAVIGNRVWLSGTDDDAIWFSNEIVDGEAPTFSGTLTLAPFAGGRVVGMAGMDEKKIILKSGALYYVIGDGPGIDGLNGTFSTPVRIPCTVGCTDARSIVSTPAGVLFLSQNGLALLGRDLSVTLVGKAVEDSVGAAGIVAATVVPEQDLVRFCVASTMRSVEFDMLHGGAWGTNTYSDPASAGSPTLVGATYCRGSWWHLTSEGKLFQESTSSWLDVSNGTSGYPVMRVRLRYIALSDLQGYQRVWWVSVDGDTKSPHDLNVKLYVDDEAASTQSQTFTALTMSTWGRYQAQVHVLHQECEALSVEVFDGSPTGVALGTGQGFTLYGVSMEVGIERGVRRVPSGQSA